MERNELTTEAHTNTTPVLWTGWISVENELPSHEMNGEQIILCLDYQKTEPLVLCGVWKDNEFHCLETDDVFDNVSHWTHLPKYPYP